MAEKSTIEWTDTTWNPVTGCTKISTGCDNCYAARFSERFRGVPGHPFENGFDLTIRPERLQQIRHERRPDSRYASSQQVQYELRTAQAMFARYAIPSLDTTEMSIEEIASRILNTTGIERRLRP